MIVLLFMFVCAYCLLAVLISRNIKSGIGGTIKIQPFVSVIIAFKNEEENLPRLFESLRQLKYPSEKMEIILIDDASTDQSGILIKQFKSTAENVLSIRLSQNEKEKPGKAGALLAGIDQSRGDIIFISDADCQVPPDWISSLLPAFQNDVGVVGGYTYIAQADSWFGHLQALDWRYLLSVASAASQLNRPITWVGNNLAILRKAYNEVGGYRNVADSFVEDFALIDAIERNTRWQCRFYASDDGAVKTGPAPTLIRLYQQRKRWAAGIRNVRPFGLLIMTTAFVTNILIILNIALQPVCGLIALILKIWGDIRIFAHRSSVDVKPKIGCMLLFQIYMIANYLVLPFFFLFDRRIVWKGDPYKIQQSKMD